MPNSILQKDKRGPTLEKREFASYRIAIRLGVLCFLLLLRSTGLIYMCLQCSSGYKIQDKGTSENISSLPEVLPPHTGKKHTNEKISCSSEALLPHTEKGCDMCYGKWSCCGKMCYYFSKDVKNWNESKKSCEDRGSSLINIDDEEEQKFIQAKIKYNYWIGLYAGTLRNSRLSQTLDFQPATPVAKCGQIKLTEIVSALCTLQFRYICEKKFEILDN